MPPERNAEEPMGPQVDPMNWGSIWIRVEPGFAFSYGEGPILLELASEADPLEIVEGALVVIRGGNGSGKTTLLNVLSGLLQPRRGHVVFGRKTNATIKELAIDDRSRRRGALRTAAAIAGSCNGIRRSFQTPVVPPGMKVGDFVSLGPAAQKAPTAARLLSIDKWVTPALSRQRRDQAGWFMRRYGLLPNALLGELSLGEKRLAVLARIMSSGARVWMLDEPFANLHQSAVERVIEDLSDHCGPGRRGAVVVVEHLATNLDEGVTNVVELREGQISSSQNRRGRG